MGAPPGGTDAAPGGPAGSTPTRTAILAEVERLHGEMLAAVDAGDWPAAKAIEARMLAQALTLHRGGRIASPAAFCRALGVSRSAHDYVVRTYADGRGAPARPHADGPAAKALRAFRLAGDVRFRAGA